jgi:hypothetical protein
LSWGQYYTGAVLHNAGFIGSDYTGYVLGDIIGIAYSSDNSTLQFYRDGSANGTIITGVTTPIFASVGAGDANKACFCNFGQIPFTYAPPAGYNAGIYK